MPIAPKKAPSIRDAEDIYQRENRKIAGQYNSQPLANGILIKGITLSSTTKRVSHQLSRPYAGFIVVDQNAQADVWRDASDTSRPQDAIPLKASANVTVSLWVF